MSIELMQCPRCGAPLKVEPTARFATCTYCGSRLRVTRGASGHPLAVLTDIKDDTGIIARQTAIDHLQGRLQVLRQKRDELESRMLQEYDVAISSPDAPQKPTLATIFPLVSKYSCIVGCAILLTAPMLLLAPLLVYYLFGDYLQSQFHLSEADAQLAMRLIIGLVILGMMATWAWSQTKQEEWAKKKQEWDTRAWRKVEANYSSEVSQIDEQIQSTEQRIAQLKADMDRLAGEV